MYTVMVLTTFSVMLLFFVGFEDFRPISASHAKVFDFFNLAVLIVSQVST